ncbi:MAG: DUF1273 family protein [Clostridia bacterium]|nr:DUF1273 family protein [Clostridia bacterium]
MNINHTCCFFGHRTSPKTEELKKQLSGIIENLIITEKVDTFLLGSKSNFNDLCLETLTEIKEKYPNIKRVYVRAEYPNINDEYKKYLLKSYEDTYFPKNIIGAGRSVYIKRNCEMINNSKFCIIYYNEQHLPKTRKSGTKIALDYAKKQGKNIYIL